MQAQTRHAAATLISTPCSSRLRASRLVAPGPGCAAGGRGKHACKHQSRGRSDPSPPASATSFKGRLKRAVQYRRTACFSQGARRLLANHSSDGPSRNLR